MARNFNNFSTFFLYWIHGFAEKGDYFSNTIFLIYSEEKARISNQDTNKANFMECRIGKTILLIQVSFLVKNF